VTYLSFGRLTLALGLCPLASPALAQAADQPQAQDEIVVTATGLAQVEAQSGFAISRIDKDDLLGQQSPLLSDVLEELPGVNITQSGGFGGTTAVRIRGAEGDQTLVLIDGIRVNDPSSPDGAFDFANLLSDQIGSVEVLRGANSVPWGSQAIGGVVYIQTEAPSDTLGISANTEYGSFDSLRLSSRLSGRVGGVGLALGGGYFRSDGISAFAGGSERDPYEQFAISGRADVAIGSAITLDAAAFFSDADIASDSVFPPFSSDDATESQTQQLYARVGGEVKLLGGDLVQRIDFALSDINRAIVNPFFTSRPQGRTERLSYRGSWRASSAVTLLFGGESENSRYDDSGIGDATGIDSLFAQLRLTPVTGLTLGAGVRQDWHEDFGSETSFSADASYLIGGGDGPRLTAAYSEGFRAPSLIDLDGSLFGFGTPDLRPERAKSYEIGIGDTLRSETLEWQVNLFRRDTDDQIIFAACPALPDPAPAICANGGRPFGTTQNVERTRVNGAEFAVTLRPSERVQFAANYTYLDNRNRSPGANEGNRLQRRPVHSAYAEIRYAFAFGLEVAADLNLVSDSFDDSANSRPIDGYALTGLRARWPVTDSIEIYGRLDNLFDIEYATASDFGTFGRSAFFGIRSRF
jgi:vitamin B12 transporter